jgi:hypothetical protein
MSHIEHNIRENSASQTVVSDGLGETFEGGWHPIETAPDLERVMVCGWQQPHGNVIGYWWWGEDVCDNGRGIECPNALYWTPIVLPSMPAPPSTNTNEVTL